MIVERERDLENASGALCVLASGSSGNCSVLVVPKTETSARRVILIDAGLSPSRTAKFLHTRGIRADEVDEIVFTHLDSDHCHAGWPKAIRPGSWRATLRIHRMHMGRAERMGLLYTRVEPFDESFNAAPNIRFGVEMLAHDDLGVATFRIGIGKHAERPDASLGFATDLGRVTSGLIEHLRGVDVLAIESNYCPEMQLASNRPAFLKKRIMGGSGHLSNEEAARAIGLIEPSERLVLLHLSQQCNCPVTAARAHRHHRWEPTISTQNEPTPWIPIRAARDAAQPAPVIRTRHTQGRLFAAPSADTR